MATKPIVIDTKLIEKARRTPKAFAAIYWQYLNPVYRYVYRRLGNVHEAEDITSQVFVEALEGLIDGRYHEDGCFSAWLFTIAAHKLVDFYRLRQPMQLDDNHITEENLPAVVEANEDRRHLTKLLAELEEEKQELLRLRFSAGLSFAEIAALDGRNEASVKMAVYRCIDWLREHWEARDG
jgi:RNA polymerase sigma-70 factor (ECF subfamily)